MTGRVDFNKSMDFWQQDKWNGYFSVKWHIIKDVPNPQLRHIILENNDHKPVTNSRDTQEVCIHSKSNNLLTKSWLFLLYAYSSCLCWFHFQVSFPQGVEMLNIFKNYVARTSILDDFEFYESRQKVLQEKKTRQSMPHTSVQVCFTLQPYSKITKYSSHWFPLFLFDMIDNGNSWCAHLIVGPHWHNCSWSRNSFAISDQCLVDKKILKL